MKNVHKFAIVVLTGLALSGCGETFSPGMRGAKPTAVVPSPQEGATSTRPVERPSSLQPTAPKPTTSAQTAEQFDTTTSAQRAEAVAATPASAERKLGTTVGSLGNPAEPGFWLKTPLVSAATEGRVVYPVNGKSVSVDLIPIDGPKTAGSRVSLAALRLLGAPLAGLSELIVYAE